MAPCIQSNSVKPTSELPKGTNKLKDEIVSTEEDISSKSNSICSCSVTSLIDKEQANKVVGELDTDKEEGNSHELGHFERLNTITKLKSDDFLEIGVEGKHARPVVMQKVKFSSSCLDTSGDYDPSTQGEEVGGITEQSVEVEEEIIFSGQVTSLDTNAEDRCEEGIQASVLSGLPSKVEEICMNSKGHLRCDDFDSSSSVEYNPGETIAFADKADASNAFSTGDLQCHAGGHTAREVELTTASKENLSNANGSGRLKTNSGYNNSEYIMSPEFSLTSVFSEQAEEGQNRVISAIKIAHSESSTLLIELERWCHSDEMFLLESQEPSLDKSKEAEESALVSSYKGVSLAPVAGFRKDEILSFGVHQFNSGEMFLSESQQPNLDKSKEAEENALISSYKGANLDAIAEFKSDNILPLGACLTNLYAGKYKSLDMTINACISGEILTLEGQQANLNIESKELEEIRISLTKDIRIDTIATFKGDKILQTFCQYTSLEVDKSNEGNQIAIFSNNSVNVHPNNGFRSGELLSLDGIDESKKTETLISPNKSENLEMVAECEYLLVESHQENLDIEEWNEFKKVAKSSSHKILAKREIHHNDAEVFLTIQSEEICSVTETSIHCKECNRYPCRLDINNESSCEVIQAYEKESTLLTESLVIKPYQLPVDSLDEASIVFSEYSMENSGKRIRVIESTKFKSSLVKHTYCVSFWYSFELLQSSSKPSPLLTNSEDCTKYLMNNTNNNKEALLLMDSLQLKNSESYKNTKMKTLQFHQIVKFSSLLNLLEILTTNMTRNGKEFDMSAHNRCMYNFVNKNCYSGKKFINSFLTPRNIFAENMRIAEQEVSKFEQILNKIWKISKFRLKHVCSSRRAVKQTSEQSTNVKMSFSLRMLHAFMQRLETLHNSVLNEKFVVTIDLVCEERNGDRYGMLLQLSSGLRLKASGIFYKSTKEVLKKGVYHSSRFQEVLQKLNRSGTYKITNKTVHKFYLHVSLSSDSNTANINFWHRRTENTEISMLHDEVTYRTVKGNSALLQSSESWCIRCTNYRHASACDFMQPSHEPVGNISGHNHVDVSLRESGAPSEPHEVKVTKSLEALMSKQTLELEGSFSGNSVGKGTLLQQVCSSVDDHTGTEAWLADSTERMPREVRKNCQPCQNTKLILLQNRLWESLERLPMPNRTPNATRLPESINKQNAETIKSFYTGSFNFRKLTRTSPQSLTNRSKSANNIMQCNDSNLILKQSSTFLSYSVSPLSSYEEKDNYLSDSVEADEEEGNVGLRRTPQTLCFRKMLERGGNSCISITDSECEMNTFSSESEQSFTDNFFPKDILLFEDSSKDKILDGPMNTTQSHELNSLEESFQYESFKTNDIFGTSLERKEYNRTCESAEHFQHCMPDKSFSYGLLKLKEPLLKIKEKYNFYWRRKLGKSRNAIKRPLKPSVPDKTLRKQKNYIISEQPLTYLHEHLEQSLKMDEEPFNISAQDLRSEESQNGSQVMDHIMEDTEQWNLISDTNECCNAQNGLEKSVQHAMPIDNSFELSDKFKNQEMNGSRLVESQGSLDSEMKINAQRKILTEIKSNIIVEKSVSTDTQPCSTSHSSDDCGQLHSHLKIEGERQVQEAKLGELPEDSNHVNPKPRNSEDFLVQWPGFINPLEDLYKTDHTAKLDLDSKYEESSITGQMADLKQMEKVKRCRFGFRRRSKKLLRTEKSETLEITKEGEESKLHVCSHKRSAHQNYLNKLKRSVDKTVPNAGNTGTTSMSSPYEKENERKQSSYDDKPHTVGMLNNKKTHRHVEQEINSNVDESDLVKRQLGRCSSSLINFDILYSSIRNDNTREIDHQSWDSKFKRHSLKYAILAYMIDEVQISKLKSVLISLQKKLIWKSAKVRLNKL